MTINPNVERAAKVLMEWGWSSPLAHQLAQALSDLDLLVTPLHAEALEACEKYSANFAEWYFDAAEECELVRRVGRRSLAAKAAAKSAAEKKERWVVREYKSGSPRRFGVREAALSDECWDRFLGTEPEARAVAVALNAESRGER